MSPYADLTLSGETLLDEAGGRPDPHADGLRIRVPDYVNGADAADPRISPVFGDLRGLPPLLIQVGSHEILLSDALRLAGQAATADVQVTLEVAPGVPHVFQGFAAVLDEGDAALDRASTFLDDAICCDSTRRKKERKTMNNRDLGVWTYEGGCALVLIDYQKEMVEVIRSETSADWSTSTSACSPRRPRRSRCRSSSRPWASDGFNGPTLPSSSPSCRASSRSTGSSMNAFEDQAFREAVEATGRKRLIIGALQTEICLAFPMVEAPQGRIRRDVRGGRGRRAFAGCPPHGIDG